MLTAGGQDVYLSREKFELGRNFANKLWNASRFILMNLDKDKVAKDISQVTISELKERWILSRLHQLIRHTTAALDKYRFNEAAKGIYEFFWREFCDWYIELSKDTVNSPATQAVLYYVLKKVLKLLHPFMPFITEEIWQMLEESRKPLSVSISLWPEFESTFVSRAADAEMAELIALITAVRNIRAQWHIQPKDSVDIYVKTAQSSIAKKLARHTGAIKRLARADKINIDKKVRRPPKSAAAVVKNMDIYVPLSRVINIEKERQRLQKEQIQFKDLLRRVEDKLENKAFLKNAPADIVTAQRERKRELNSLLKRIELNLKAVR
jgi:valyl-tRNA synthetase